MTCSPWRRSWSGSAATRRSASELRVAARGSGEARPWVEVTDEVEAVYRRLAGRRHDPEGNPEIRRRLRDREYVHVDLHMHTDHSPDCATPAELLLETAKERGLGAIAITDHNEISGALEAREIAERIGGIRVIVAEEVKTAHEGEVIGLFLSERIERGMSMAETIAEIRRQGGLVYVPHPFDRLHSVPDYEHLLEIVDQIDILEVFNPRVTLSAFNEEAVRFARKYSIVPGAGSDSHVAQGLGSVKIRLRDFDGPQEFLESMREADIVRKHKNLVYVQALKFLQTSGGRGGRSLAERDGEQDAVPPSQREQELMHPQGAGPGPKKRQGAVSSITDDEIREKYLERAIRELNDLGRDLAACQDCPRGNVMPVQGSGHPQADILMLKRSATASEIEEGVAFYGRAGNALMKSFKRLAIDPIVVFGTLCVKCPLTDPTHASEACVARVAEEIAIVQPRIVVVMGDEALDTLNDLELPLAERIDPIEGEVQRLTPTIGRAVRARHRRLTRHRGREAALLVGLQGARRVVRPSAAVLGRPGIDSFHGARGADDRAAARPVPELRRQAHRRREGDRAHRWSAERPRAVHDLRVGGGPGRGRRRRRGRRPSAGASCAWGSRGRRRDCGFLPAARR